jgi:hypothetical protein
MINFPTYKLLTGIAERIIRISAVATVSEGLVFQTSLKKEGRFPSAENRSFKVIFATAEFLVDQSYPIEMPAVLKYVST